MKITKPHTLENRLLVGFPSNGLVGTFSVSYIIQHLKMKQIGEIDLADLPSTLFVENGQIFGPIRIYGKNNIFVIISDLPFNQDLAKDFGHEIHNFCKKKEIKKIIIVSGMDTVHKKIESPKIYGLVTHQNLESVLYSNEIPKFLDGSIFGIDASIISIFRKTKIPLIALYAECHPYFPDPEAAIAAIDTLAKILAIKIDTKDIQKKVDILRIQHRRLMEETIRTLQQQKEKQSGAPQIYR